MRDDFGRRFAQIVFAREHARFGIVDEQKVPFRDGLKQLSPKIGDPVVHGVAAHELHRRVHLRSDRALQRRLDVTKQKIGRALVRFGQFRIESREDVQVRNERFAIVHILRINARPEEGFPRHAFEAGEIDAARREQIDILLIEIVTHHRDDLRLREITGGESDISACAAEHAVYFSVRSFHSVVCD